MRVAVIPTVRDFPWGAPGHCMASLVEALLQQGHQVLWLVAPIDIDHPEVRRLEGLGADLRPLPPPPPRYVRLFAIRSAIRRAMAPGESLKAIVGAFRPDFLFFNQGGTWCALEQAFFELLESHPGRYALICHLNKPEPAFSPERLGRARRAAQGAARMFFNSDWTRQLTQTQLAADVPNFSYYQYPVRFAFSGPLPWPRHEQPHLAMVNRLDAFHKGIDIAFAAVARLKEEGIAIHLNLYGEGFDGAYLRELARFTDVQDVVAFHGHTEDIASIWATQEMLLLPSRYEGSPVAVTEAMGFGRPVLRTACGGASEWIRDGENGYLCPAAETALLCDTLRRAIAQRDRWQAMGIEAFETIRRSLDLTPAQAFLQALPSEPSSS